MNNANNRTNLLNKIEQAARETRAMVAKEMGYLAHLRNDAKIAELNAHLETLAKMRGAAFNS